MAAANRGQAWSTANLDPTYVAAPAPATPAARPASASRAVAGWRRPPLAGAGADHGVCHVRHVGPADSDRPLAGRGASGLGDAAELGGQEPLPAVSDYI